jgi:hypothetical protein
MPAGTAAGPVLERFEFQVGGRWFPCVDRMDPDHLIGVMRRAQHPPTDPYDPTLNDWLATVFGFVLMAATPDVRDDVNRAVIEAVDRDPDGTIAHLAVVFAELLAAFTVRQMDEIRAQIVANEQAAATPFPGRPVDNPVDVWLAGYEESQSLAVRRTSLDQLRSIQARHGSKATGRIID